MSQLFTDLAASWEPVELVPEDLWQEGDRVVVVGFQRNVGRASGVPVTMPRGWIVELRDAKAARLTSFNSLQEALDSAGLSE